MRILLTETRGDREQAQREFNQPVIKVGRDPQQCDIVFNQATWPMVSRVHAELRIEERRCLLIDNKSTQGTFLNQHAVVGEEEIQTGDQIQFGLDGPILGLEIIEEKQVDLLDTPVATPSSLVESPVAPLQIHERPPTAEPNKASLPVSPVLVFESGVAPEHGKHLVLKSETTLLGRDPTSDVPVDAASPVVSRRHAEIRRTDDGRFTVVDLKSFNGTLVNGQRIAQPTLLQDGDRIQLSVSGPVLRFVDPSHALPQSDQTADTQITPGVPVDVAPVLNRNSAVGLGNLEIGQSTIVHRSGTTRPQPGPVSQKAREQLLLRCSFDGKDWLGVGRATDNDIHLDGLLISKYHARFTRTPGQLLIEDAGSTNGVYLNGARVSGKRPVLARDIVQIGPFVLKADPITGIEVFDTRSETRIDAIDITNEVPRLGGVGTVKLLDGVSLAIEPNEFIGVLGPSGAGKSTLINSLNGMKGTSGGRIFMNNLDLYQHLDSLKQSIGYVPQDDIIHRELTCYHTLYYVARLRLSRDVPAEDIDQIINEVLEVTGLAERRDALISQLSGGQRKRVSIAVELITKPSVIFLDEPTSGLDPATEERVMKLFRQIAESGRTVIMTTHAMENVLLFDKIVLLMRGKLIFYGKPEEALKFVGARNFIDLYNKLEEPSQAEVGKLLPPPPTASKAEKRTYDQRQNESLEAAAEQWRQHFLATETYERNVRLPLSRVHLGGPGEPVVHLQRGASDTVRQWATLVARYARVLASDRLNLLILFGQAPVIALLTYLVIGKQDPRDFAYFVLALIPVWFGTSVAAREIVKEGSIYKRERMVNLGLLPYVGSKLFVLSWIVALQCALMFTTLKVLHFAGLMYLPGMMGGFWQWLTMVLTGIVGIALGLFVSALVRTSEVATSLVPLILIPQILFCGLVGVPFGVSRLVGAAMPATWSFDEMKRLSALDTLREEGSDPNGENQGLGLFKHVRDSNAAKIRNARSEIDDYSKKANEGFQAYDRRMKTQIARGNMDAIRSSTAPSATGTPPKIPDPEEIKDNLSEYVSFKHPWGGLFINPAILLGMLCALAAGTIFILNRKDARPLQGK